MRGAVVGLLLALLPPAGTAAAGAAAPVDPDVAQARLALALARTDSFHLVLDLRQAELRLMLGGVPLRTFPYVEAAVGSPRVAFLAGPLPGDWTARVWRDGRLDPERPRERLEITPPGPDQAPDPVVPPLPTEGPPPPWRYTLRFPGGLDLEIRRPGVAGGAGLRERLRLLASPGRPRLRVGLVMADDDASGLYRCLPPGVTLVVLGRPARTASSPATPTGPAAAPGSRTS